MIAYCITRTTYIGAARKRWETVVRGGMAPPKQGSNTKSHSLWVIFN